LEVVEAAPGKDGAGKAVVATPDLVLLDLGPRTWKARR